MLNSIRELVRYRGLLWMWVLREIKIRYKQSFLGAAWAVLQPLALMIIFSIVFTRLTQVPTTGIPYPLFSYVAVLPWTFLATSISFGVPSLINNLNLVTKIYFPREILPLGAIGASFFDYLIASSIFVLMLLFYRVQITSAILWLPVVLFIQLILIIGVTLLGAAIIIHYRDLRFIVPLGLQIWLYASPVIYPISLVPEEWRLLYRLNPMAGVISSYRQIILHGEPPLFESLMPSMIVGIIIFISGYFIFEKLETSFADLI